MRCRNLTLSRGGNRLAGAYVKGGGGAKGFRSCFVFLWLTSRSESGLFSGRQTCRQSAARGSSCRGQPG
jgi:hypothetical protein